MIRLVYNLALGLGVIGAAPYITGRMARGRYRNVSRAKLGVGQDWMPGKQARGGIWVHALSVGEVGSALPLVKALRDRFPEYPLALSLSTAQGLALAAEQLGGREDIHLFLRPLDFPWAVKKLSERLAPRLFVLVEGDLWPNWQHEMGRRRVPRLWVNARVSSSTHKGYRRIRPLVRELLLNFESILAQSGLDSGRLVDVGVSPELVKKGGNLKFDSAPTRLKTEEIEVLANELGLAGRTVLAAGSTHPGEEKICLKAFSGLARKQPNLALIIAPRDISRGRAVVRLAGQQGLKAAQVSRRGIPAGVQVVVLDILGILARAYALARGAFVGGSLVSDGGHNLLEPAAQGTPVLWGPHIDDFKQMARLLESAGGGRMITSAQDIESHWSRWLEDAQERDQMGAAGLEFCRAHRGAVAGAVQEAARLLGEA